MSSIGKTSFWIVFALITVIAATIRAHIDGDGVEYLMMAHAFTSHGTASLNAADFSFVANLLNGNVDPAAHKMLVDATDHLSRNTAAMPHFGFARTESGAIYAIHYWVYSMMAAPFYAAAAWFGIKPTLGFSLLNLTLVAATVLHLHRSLPSASRAAALVFLSLGTAYYLRWTGPEVMTACCAFTASICVLRRDTGLAILLCGIGATQNPSLALIIPLFAAHRLLASAVPEIVTLPVVRRSTLLEAGLAGAGIIAAISPYAFYYSAFGIPSLIAPYFTDPAFITPRRALSFMFDLDQGMLAGIPGLFIGLTGVAAVKSALNRRVVAANGLFFLLACCILAAPALAAINWNSGTSVMLRYAYWAAMPLVAFLVSALPAIAPGLRMPLVSAVLVAQCLAVLGSGLMLRSTSYMHHTPLSEWALATFPRLVNPDPEIFIERARQNEAAITLRTTQVFYDEGVPVKLLRHWSNSDDSAGLCPEGQRVSTAFVVEVDRGWQYLNAPLSCLPADPNTATLHLRFADTNESRAALDSGWAATEQAGTWTNAKRSVIRIQHPAGHEVTGLQFNGHYFAGVRASDIRINGRAIGLHSLTDKQIDVPPGLPGSELVIELMHADAASPEQLGLSADTRVLAYHLTNMRLRLRPRQSADVHAGFGLPPRPM